MCNCCTEARARCAPAASTPCAPRILTFPDAALTLSLERQGWEVHTQVDDSTMHEPSLEDLPGTADEKHAALRRQLQDVDAANAEHKRALILYCSHIGGHKYAGNVIVRASPSFLASLSAYSRLPFHRVPFHPASASAA